MSREIKFRAWNEKTKRFTKDSDNAYLSRSDNGIITEQYIGLKDKNGKEIYENCELDGRYRVEYIAPKFVGKDMVKGDIIELYDNKFTITKEHCEISQNSERGTN